MPITSRLNRKTDRKAKTFIAAVDDPTESIYARPIQVRMREDILERINLAARRRGITRSAFIVSTVVEKLESMEG